MRQRLSQCHQISEKYHQQLDSTNNLLQLSDIAELNTQIGAERLKMENIQATSRYRITLFSIVTGFCCYPCFS